MAVSGGVDPMEIDHMMEMDLEVHHREAQEPIAALKTMADALPGLGIVAAVLGVVITMGALGRAQGGDRQPRGGGPGGHVSGHSAVLWNFRAAGLGHEQAERGGEPYFGFSAHGALGFIKGLSPMMAVELARRAIPTSVRPTLPGNGGGLPRRRQAASKAA